MVHSEKYNKFNGSAKENQPILIIENESDSWIGDILAKYNFKVVYGFLNISNARVEVVTSKLVRDILRNKKLCIDCNCIQGPLSSFSRNEIIVKLLRFVLRDKPYNDLKGVPLVPILNNSHAVFGSKTYYLTKHTERMIFPKYGPNVFVDDITDQDVKEHFLNEDFQRANNIKSLDLNDYKKILKYELPKQSSLDWNPKSSSIPNRHWLNAIWDHILEFDCDLDLFAKYPLIPIDNPTPPEQLVALSSSNPLIRHPLSFNHEPMVLILEKLGVHFTEFRKAEQLKPYIFDWSPQNVLRIVGILQKSKVVSMETFLEPLNSKDRESFRKFIINNWVQFVYMQENEDKVKEEFYETIRSLPIWPTHSQDKIHMTPKNGCLLPQNISFFSPSKTDSNYFDVESEDEWIILNKLGVTVISLSSYITNVFYQLERVSPSDPDYISFICSLLRLPLTMIPDSLNRCSIIPNDSYTKLLKANELYDPSEELFREVFAGSDRFLPMELRNGWVMEGLVKLGLSRVTDSDAFIQAAREIETLSQSPSPPENLRERAKIAVRYFYYHAVELNLSSEAWETLSTIKFVPSKPVEPPFLESAYSKVPELHCFNSLCLPKDRTICWTQRPIYDDDVLPHSDICERFPEMIGINMGVVINHLYAIIKNIVNADLSEWKTSGLSELLNTVIHQIYQHLNDTESSLLKPYLKLRLKDDPNIFLNGEDPFNPYNWVSAKELVLNIDEDINSKNRAVCARLAFYKRLLRNCEAQEMKHPRMDMQAPNEYSQRERLARSFARFLDEQHNSVNKSCERCGAYKFHDIFFHVHGKVFGSNRYVLAASANYFERMFTAGTMESNLLEPVHVNVDDIKPETFCIMLKWLYGRSFEDALSEIKIPQMDDEISFLLEIYIDLLNACEKYDLQELKRLVEHKIVNNDLIKPQNVIEVRKWAEKYSAMQLFSYCKDYKKENLKLLIDRCNEDLLNVDDDEFSEVLENYDEEFGNLEWRFKDHEDLSEFEKNCGW